MNPSRLSVTTLGVCLLLAVEVCGQTQRPTAIRPGEPSPTVVRPVEPDSPATNSTLAAGPQAVVPRLMKFSGALHDGTGKPLTGTVDVTFSLYSTEAGGNPLWFETQSVQSDELGRYTALLGSMHTDGLPVDLFTSGEVRWLGIQMGAEAEQQPRVLLVSVPYALKAGDAETLGGKPASAYMLSDTQNGTVSASTTTTSTTGTAQTGTSDKTQKGRKANASPLVACPSLTSDGTATANSITMFTTACNIENSVITQVGGNVGIGTASPQTLLHLQNGSLMLRDGGAWPLTMEQSFGSVFVITNGGTNQMSFDYNGNLGVGTTSPLARVHIQNGSLILRDGGAWPLTMEQGFGSIFTITNGGNKQLAFDYNGNLGIGTTTPTAKLEVNGTTKFDGAATFAAGQSVTGNVSASGQLTSTVATGTPPLSVASTTQVTNLNASQLGGLTSSAFALLSGGNSFVGNQSVTGNLFTTGSIGVGTATPSFPLQVSGLDATTTGIQARVTNTSTTSNSFALFAATAGTGFTAVGTLMAGDAVGSGPLGVAGGYFGTFTSHPVGIVTGNVERMRITGSGLVGIGTTTPDGELGVDAGSSTNTALAIERGAIRVVGAGAGTSTPAFVHVINTGIGGNICANTSFTITDNPLTNGDPNAILFVTASANHYTGSETPSALMVIYDEAGACGIAGRWLIYRTDGAALVDGARINVLVIKP